MKTDEEHAASELIRQLDKRHGIYAAPVAVDSQRQTGETLKGVNVWKSPYDRYPTDTAWFGGGTVTWGGNFQNERPLPVDATELADAIAESL